MAIIFGAVLLLGTLVSGVSCDTSITQNGTQTTSAPLIDFNNVNSASSQSANGLSLSIFLDATTYRPGQQVSIVIDVRNTLSNANLIPVSSDWSYNDLGLGQCDLGSPYGIAIFQGNYTSSDFSAATPLSLYDYNLTVPCSTSIPISSYDFEPLSDIATALSRFASIPNSTYAINTELTEAGYWTGNIPNATKHNFTPGVYSVVAGDEWGALVMVHFTVTS
jgi:hypothetical protein